MARGVFIVGTDTEVGKTVITAGLALVLRKRGVSVGIIKPIATGCEKQEGNFYSEDAAFLAAAAGIPDDLAVTPFRYLSPVAPLVAATLEGPMLDSKTIVRSCQHVMGSYELTIIEGIGGLMVPITHQYFVRDLITDLGLPVIIVARLGLGTINHTLLTVEALKQRHCKIQGILLNTCTETVSTITERTNPAAIQHLSGVPIIGVLPFVKGLSIKQKEFGSLENDFQSSIKIEAIL